MLDIVASDGGYKDGLNVFWQVFLKLLHHGFVDDVAFGDSQNTLLVEQLGIIASQLFEKNFVFAVDVELFTTDHEEQKRITLNMSQEPESKTFPLAGSFYYSGDVGNTEGLVIMVLDNAEVGNQGGERVVSYFGFGGRDNTEKGDLPALGKPTRPTSASTLSSMTIHLSMAGSPGCA